MTKTAALLVVVAVILLMLKLWLVLGAQPTQPLPQFNCPIGTGANAPVECAR